MSNRLQVVARQNPIQVETYEENLDSFSDWSSIIDAILGFDTASFTLRGTKLHLEDWFANGLGRQITRYAPDGVFVVWQGFVNQMSLVEPGTRSVITLDGIANNIQAKYNAIDTTTNPPTVAATPTLTAAATDTDSRDKYGQHDEIVNVGDSNATLATQKRDQHLNRLAWPLADDSFDTQGNNDLRLEIVCKGWIHTLAWRIYNQTTNSGTSNAHTVIGEIITSVGDLIMSTSLSENTTQIPRYFDDDRRALDIVKGIVGVGDSGGNRWVSPVYEDRILYYRQAANQVDYYRRIGDNRQAVREKGGRALPPWEVRPDKFIRTTDIFPITADDPVDMMRDPQVRYIEKVAWSEPYGLAMFGSQKSQLPQMLASNSLSGVQVI